MNFLATSLLIILSSWRVSSTGSFVTQTSDLSVMEGVTVQISCCWTVKLDRLRVHWMKNQSLYKSQFFNKTDCTGSQHKEECSCSTLTFQNITREDSGRYVCKVTVEIPTYAAYEGNGTLITVMAKENSDSPEEKNEKGPKELGVSSTGTFVTQTPDLSVMEGVTVQISCCWTVEFYRLRLNWIKTQSVYKSQSVHKTDCTGSQHKEECSCSTLTFPTITREDSGRYVCKVTVEIPTYAAYEGNGTLITVMAKKNSDSPEEKNEKGPKELGSDRLEVLIYVLRCLPILALVGTFFYFNNIWRARLQQHATDDPGNKNTSATTEEKDEEQEESDETETKLDTEEERM